MEYEKIIKNLKGRKKGTIISVCYESEPTLSASAKKQGYDLKKITQTTARFGVNYSNIKAVQEQREQDKQQGIERKQMPIWWNWKDKNIIKQHNTNGNLYLTLTKNKVAKPKIKYILNGKEITKQELQDKNIVVNSYWNKQEIQQYDVNINNIISIKEKC